MLKVATLVAILGSIVCLAGCPAQTSGGSTMVGGSPDATTPVREDNRLAGSNVLRSDFEKMQGMTVEQAKAYAKSIGHTGELQVKELTDFMTGCSEGTVCEATHAFGSQSGMSKTDVLVLWTNKTLSIAPPPE